MVGPGLIGSGCLLVVNWLVHHGFLSGRVCLVVPLAVSLGSNWGSSGVCWGVPHGVH